MKKNTSKYHKLNILDELEMLNAKSNTLDFPFHFHDTFNIALILESTFTTKLFNKCISAPVGTISITNPYEVHATICDKDLGNSFFNYYVSPDVFKKFNNGEDVFFEDKIVYDQGIFNELYFLSQQFQDKNIEFESRLSVAIKLLISKYAIEKPFNFKTTQLFQTFINETSFESFSLDKTARQFGLNKYKFLRLFKQETGLTPNSYVQLKRIEKSKKMLKEGKSIADISIDIGFYDESHYYKYFTRFTGVTPLEFQNACLLCY